MILLTPGPCMTSESVRLAAALPDMNHRDPLYLDLVREVKEGLLGVYGDEHAAAFTPYLIGGSGTAAVESMVTSCVNAGPILVLENGYYSSRLASILEVHRIPYEVVKFGWLEAWDMARVEEVLSNGRFEAVLATHNETTVGRLNPVDELSELCWTYDARLLVDAMSSFGADPLDFYGVDAVCASANKCLHGIPGVSFVLVKNDLAKRMPRYPRRTYYLSLPMYGGDSPLTPPVPALSSLRQALREMEGGQGARRARYQRQADLIRDRLVTLGFSLAIERPEFSCALTTVSLPSGYSWNSWFEANMAAGFMVYGCKGDLKERFFQVSTMGEVTDDQVRGWLDFVQETAG